MRIICDICSPSAGDAEKFGFSFNCYEDWTRHLLSFGHEQGVRAKLMEMVRTEEEESFIVTFSTSREGTIPNRTQILDFFGSKGFLAQYYYDETSRFCLIRVEPMFVGCKGLREGQYMINNLHAVTCIQVQGTSDAYWKCLLRRNTPKKQAVMPKTKVVSPVSPPVGQEQDVAQRSDDGDKIKDKEPVLCNGSSIINKKNRNSPCIFDTRQMCGNNPFTNQSIDMTSATFIAQNPQHIGVVPPENFNMYRVPHPMYPYPGGGGPISGNNAGFRHMLPYPPHPTHSGPFFLPTITNQQHQQPQYYQYGNYYHPFYPAPPPPSPATPTPQIPLQQMHLNNGHNNGVDMMPQNCPTMPQIVGHPHPSFMYGGQGPVPPPGFQSMQGLDPRGTGDAAATRNEGRPEMTHSLDISFMPEAGAQDDEFLRKIQTAFGMTAVRSARESSLTVPTKSAAAQNQNNLDSRPVSSNGASSSPRTGSSTPSP